MGCFVFVLFWQKELYYILGIPLKKVKWLPKLYANGRVNHSGNYTLVEEKKYYS